MRKIEVYYGIAVGAKGKVCLAEGMIGIEKPYVAFFISYCHQAVVFEWEMC